ncbi:MAG: ATP-binding cassette domain-containing protein [Patescibacteria group bacterium]|jgi:ABC-2 type transport system ATP-binding protein
MTKPIIEVSGVSRLFGKTTALAGVNLAVEKGTIFGLLGPNGAGKTTLIRILATLLPPSSGKATISGLDVVKEPAKVRKIIGLAGQYAAVDDFLTGRETLKMIGSLYHLPNHETRKRADNLLERLGLTDAADRIVRTYSGGMRRRLDLGASLIGEPKVIFLDEPTTGLDPRTRLELWDIIKDLVKNGATILLTTQYLEEADALASYIAVIDRGSVVAKGTSTELKSSLGRDIVEVAIRPEDKSGAMKLLAKIAGKEIVFDETTGHFRVPAKEGSKTLLSVARALEEGNIQADEIALHRPSLDDVFLAVTGNKTINDEKR